MCQEVGDSLDALRREEYVFPSLKFLIRKIPGYFIEEHESPFENGWD